MWSILPYFQVFQGSLMLRVQRVLQVLEVWSVLRPSVHGFDNFIRILLHKTFTDGVGVGANYLGGGGGHGAGVLESICFDENINTKRLRPGGGGERVG